VVVLGLAMACKTSSPSTEKSVLPTASSAASGDVDAAPSVAVAVPVGAPKVAGTLVDKPFQLAKALLRVEAEGATLDLYAWSEGEACAPQFAPKPEQLSSP
jgi:hypothetical protein